MPKTIDIWRNHLMNRFIKYPDSYGKMFILREMYPEGIVKKDYGEHGKDGAIFQKYLIKSATEQ